VEANVSIKLLLYSDLALSISLDSDCSAACSWLLLLDVEYLLNLRFRDLILLI